MSGTPLTINRGGGGIGFAYGPEHQRIKQTTLTETTHCFGLAAGGHVERAKLWANYLYAGARMIGVVYEYPSPGTDPLVYGGYSHTDHPGSIETLTDETGAVMSYDPWGRRRFLDGRDDPQETIPNWTNRGYTGHEHLEEVGLIHMNGRIYDPLIGRFLTADPFVEDLADAQSFNRYSYGRNNPLNRTDPTGFGTDEADAAAQERAEARASEHESNSSRSDRDFWDGVSDFFGGIGDAIGPLVGGIADAVGPVLGGVADGIRAVGNGIQRTLEAVARNETVRSIARAVGTVVGTIWNLPNTMVGLAYGIVGFPVGLANSPVGGRSSRRGYVSGRPGYNSPIVPSCCRPSTLEMYGTARSHQPTFKRYKNTIFERELQDEENKHVPQGMVFGGFCGPLHVVVGSTALAVDGKWRGPTNVLETGPHSGIPRA